MAHYFPDQSRRRHLLDALSEVKDGSKVCADQLGSNYGWQYIRTEEVEKDKTYVHTCRRCGLPRDAVLMW